MLIEKSNQTLIVETGRDLSTATDPKIVYRKPDGTTGEWTATIEGTTLKYTTASDDITVAADSWDFQAKVTISGNEIPGEVVSVYIQPTIETS